MGEVLCMKGPTACLPDIQEADVGEFLEGIKYVGAMYSPTWGALPRGVRLS